MNKKKDLDERLYEKHKKAAVYARKLGFDKVDYNKSYGSFKAEHKYTNVYVYAIMKYGSRYEVDIGWSSSGSKPDNRRIKRTAEMLLNTIKLKNYLLGRK
ncbi:MAG: hypothetical protein J7L32_07325 [Thermoplasmata archaeon]|nr:hypothetical protein [Thermoplasmata archaeon]